MLYFAYGSNMLTERLQARVPSAEPVGTARLPGYTLRFHKRGSDGTAKCTVTMRTVTEHAESLSPVIGVCFTMDAVDLALLDTAEGCGSGYEREMVELDRDGRSEHALAYVADPAYVDPSLTPYRWYRALVIAGAVQHGLPDAYVEAIRRVEAVWDPKTERRKTALQLIRDAEVDRVDPEENGFSSST